MRKHDEVIAFPSADLCVSVRKPIKLFGNLLVMLHFRVYLLQDSMQNFFFFLGFILEKFDI